MKKINFIENPKEETNLDRKMFPQMFELTEKDLSSLKGGALAIEDEPCDAVCLPSEWGGSCNCLSNLC